MDTTKKRKNPSQTTSIPRLSEEEMDDLMLRAAENDAEALSQLSQIIADAPADWKLANSMVNIARASFFRLLEGRGKILATAVEGAVMILLDLLDKRKSDEDLIQNLLVEHTQMAVLAANYNRLLLMDGGLTARRHTEIENRLRRADDMVKDCIRRLDEYRFAVAFQKSLRRSEPSAPNSPASDSR
jgi:hypothetical protein